MSQHLGVSTSVYYVWCTRKPSQRSVNDRVMTERTRQILVKSDYTYGRIRIQAELQDMGLQVNLKRIYTA